MKNACFAALLVSACVPGERTSDQEGASVYSASASPLAAAPVPATDMLAVDPQPTEVLSAEPLALPPDDETVDHLQNAAEAWLDDRYEVALRFARQHLHQAPDDKDALELVARAAEQLKDYDRARAAAQRRLEQDVDDPALHLLLGRIAFASGDHAAARAALEQAVRLDDGQDTAWNLLGRIALAESHWHRAERAFLQATEIAPLTGMYHNNLGLAYIFARKADDAVAALQHAVSLLDEAVPHFVHNNLGLALELSGDLEEAEAAFLDALRIDPFYGKASINLKRVRRAIEDRVLGPAVPPSEAAHEIHPAPARGPDPLALGAGHGTKDLEAPADVVSDGDEEARLPAGEVLLGAPSER